MKVRLHLDRQALFCDETSEYRIPPEPDYNERVTIRFRTARDNADQVYLICGTTETKMEKRKSEGEFDYYEGIICLREDAIHYYFEISRGKELCYYNKLGCTTDIQEAYSFCITPGFHTPEWAKGAVFYQIFVDRFRNGSKENDPLDREYAYIGGHTVAVKDWEKYPDALDVRCFYGGDLQGVEEKLDYLKELDREYAYIGGHTVAVKDWEKYPDALDVRCFYGGDLQGVEEKLDYLKDLGVDVIYFNPLFVSPSNHKYDIQDYDYIDPHFAVICEDDGDLMKEDNFNNQAATRYIARVTKKENLESSNAYFARLVQKIHEKGMRVILDGVFNHCGSFNKWMDRERIYEKQEGYEPGAYISEDSPYRSFFRFRRNKWPYNADYDGWWGHETLPKLNYEDSDELHDYVMHIAEKWVSPPYCVDGWRLDVAADLGRSNEYNHKFWQDFRKTVKRANPDALILAEHYGDPSSWMRGDQWDTVMKSNEYNHKFWQDFRKTVKRANPDALILAEHYGDPSSWMRGDQWDTVMNYDAFMEPITWFLTGMEKHSDESNQQLYGNGDWFFRTMAYNMSKFQHASLEVAMNELSNHDHSRFLTRTNRMIGRTVTKGPEAAGENINKGVFREGVVIQLTWPGAPTIYYGDEAGQVGWTDPDNRRTYPWGKEDWELIEFHRYMITLHKTIPCLKNGSLKPLISGEHLIVYGRFTKETKAVIIVNNKAEYRNVSIPVWEIEVPLEAEMARVMKTTQAGYNVGRVWETVKDGYLNLSMDPISAAVYLWDNR